MKKILVVLLVSISLAGSAQNWKRTFAVVGYHTVTVALGAVADGLYDNGSKDWGHALHAAEIAAIIGGPFVLKIDRSEILSYMLSYGFIRFSFFDSFYNLTRDLPILYNGTTSFYDRTLNQVPEHGRAFYKSWSLVVGFAIPLNELR